MTYRRIAPYARRIFPFFPLLLVGAQWMTDTVQSDHLLWEVPEVARLTWLETRYTYLYLHLFTFLPVFLLSFDRRVHYYKEWKYLLPAILIMAIPFILWDVFFTAKGVWDFNPAYFLGIRFLHLPLEEWLFFFTVPFACVFIYECLNYYVPKDWFARSEAMITGGLACLFLAVGFWRWTHMYTATTFLLAGSFCLYHFLFLRNATYRGRFYMAYVVSWIPFLLVNGVLTGGYTQAPIVLYNPAEYFGWRITSVPVDDSVYSFLLLFGTVTFFEFFRKK